LQALLEPKWLRTERFVLLNGPVQPGTNFRFLKIELTIPNVGTEDYHRKELTVPDLETFRTYKTRGDHCKELRLQEV